MADSRTAICCCLLGCLAGCAPSVRHVEPAPAKLNMVQWRGAEATVQALEKKPYLRMLRVEPQEALKARAGEAAAVKGEGGVGSVRQTLASARDLYRKMQFDEAVSRLRKARALLGQHASGAEHFKLLSMLAMQLGLNHLALKDEPAARRASTATAPPPPGPCLPRWRPSSRPRARAWRGKPGAASASRPSPPAPGYGWTARRWGCPR